MDINDIMAEVAQKEGVSVRELKDKVQAAIDAAMASPDPKVQAFWNVMPYVGEKPTPEEVIGYLAGGIAG